MTTPKSKAIDIYCEILEGYRSLSFFNFKEHQTECEVVAKYRTQVFVKTQILPTIGSEGDLQFWNDVLQELNSVDFPSGDES